MAGPGPHPALVGDAARRRPTRPRPCPTGLEGRFPGISDLRPPIEDFYRVDTRLALPVVAVDDWTLTIDGDVDRELRLTFDELVAMPLVERDITLTCVSNEVGGGYVGAARWLGVPLADLLDRAGVGSTGRPDPLHRRRRLHHQHAPRGRPGRPRHAVAVGMNGAPLPREHGFPARLVTPGLYGFVGATKWLTRLTLTTYDDAAAYWTDRGWATDAPIKIASRIDTPRPLSTVDAGDAVIGGVAWAQHRGIAGVEVRIDGGRLAAGTPGPGRRHRLLAPVVPALERRAPASTPSPCAPAPSTGSSRPRSASRPSPTAPAASRKSS